MRFETVSERADEGSVVPRLRAALGRETVVTGEDVPPRHRADWSGMAPVTPLALIRPRHTDELARALALCHELGQPVVPQGGMTGVSGGACPGSADIALSLDRLKGVEEIDPATATMTVKAGTTLQEVQEAAEAAGFLVPLDLGARGSCTIGGNIATNAGGNRVLRYGMTREMVLGLEVVLADGTVVQSLNRMLKNNAGYDLKHLFIGSEGTLGVITRAVLRLWPRPKSSSTAFCGLEDLDAAIAFLKAARTGLAGTLSAFEVMWKPYYDLMIDKHGGLRPPLRGRHGIHVLIETQGTDPERDHEAFEAFLGGELEAGVIEDASLATSESDARDFWAIRDAVSEFQQLLGPRVEFDIGLPTSRIGACLARIEQALEARWPGIVVILYGHLGDGNIHIQVAMPEGALPPRHDIEAAVFAEIARDGGTVTAEHGLGTLKKPYVGHCRSPEELALMRTMKAALDPATILNPGKVV